MSIRVLATLRRGIITHRNYHRVIEHTVTGRRMFPALFRGGDIPERFQRK